MVINRHMFSASDSRFQVLGETYQVAASAAAPLGNHASWWLTVRQRMCDSYDSPVQQGMADRHVAASSARSARFDA